MTEYEFTRMNAVMLLTHPGWIEKEIHDLIYVHLEYLQPSTTPKGRVGHAIGRVTRPIMSSVKEQLNSYVFKKGT